jgi:hypothetical protein
MKADAVLCCYTFDSIAIVNIFFLLNVKFYVVLQ